MKGLIVIICFLPILSFAQSRRDYERTMTRFMKFYNSNQGDSINEMFSDGWKEQKATKLLWTSWRNKELLDEYGTLQSVGYLGVCKSDGITIFKASFSKGGTKAIGLLLDRKNGLETFRIATQSDEIDEMLKKGEKK